VQITSKAVSCYIDTITHVGEENSKIPINGTLKLSVNMSADQKALVEQLIGKEVLKNRADIFIETILDELNTRNRGE